MSTEKRIALFASGTGSNVQAIINHFRNTSIKAELIFTNNPKAGVLEIADRENVEARVITTQEIGTGVFIQELLDKNIELIVLAGYLKKIPATLIQAFPGKIINIHPALLPKFGGKGMYGSYVHKAVVDHKEKESGITIHFVNEVYDEGRIILQARCEVNPEETYDVVAKNVLKLEHFYYPRVIEQLLTTS